MKQDMIARLRLEFEGIVQQVGGSGIEFWWTRDLQQVLGYAQWRNFEPVVERAISSCKNAGHDPGDHFARARKMVDVGSGAQREIDDVALTRYACPLGNAEIEALLRRGPSERLRQKAP